MMTHTNFVSGLIAWPLVAGAAIQLCGCAVDGQAKAVNLCEVERIRLAATIYDEIERGDIFSARAIEACLGKADHSTCSSVDEVSVVSTWYFTREFLIIYLDKDDRAVGAYWGSFY